MEKEFEYDVAKEILVLDELLKYLLFVKESKKPYSIGMNKIDNSFRKYDASFLETAVKKLIKDEYAIQKIQYHVFSNGHIAGVFDITFEGILFIKNGGYQNHYNKLQIEQNLMSDLKSEQRIHSASLVRLNRWLVILTLIIAIGTFVAGIYYLIEILKSFGVCV